MICSHTGGGVCDCPGSTGYEEAADRILAIPTIERALMEYANNRGVAYIPTKDAEAHFAAKQPSISTHSDTE